MQLSTFFYFFHVTEASSDLMGMLSKVYGVRRACKYCQFWTLQWTTAMQSISSYCIELLNVRCDSRFTRLFWAFFVYQLRKSKYDNFRSESRHVNFQWKSMSAEVSIASVEFVNPENIGIAFGILSLSVIERDIY
jgi:hypothetical protein